VATSLDGVAVDNPLIINLADAPALSHSKRATLIKLEPEDAHWPDTAVNVQVMQPGQPNCRYHSEPVQEDFLVLYGECVVILDDQERPLRQWDFVHLPANTPHVFVGAGDRPCAVLMIGSRRANRAHYPFSELAAKYDASVTTPTDDVAEAYADWRQEPRRPTDNPFGEEPLSFRALAIQSRTPGAAASSSCVWPPRPRSTADRPDFRQLG
jgi:uncharacterized cupin superfamily protein